MKIGVLKEQAPGDRRVALVPGVAATLSTSGVEVLVETGAGAPANFPDSAYAAAGATVATRDEVRRDADVIVCVGPPDGLVLHGGQILVGLLRPHERAEQLREWAGQGATV